MSDNEFNLFDDQQQQFAGRAIGMFVIGVLSIGAVAILAVGMLIGMAVG